MKVALISDTHGMLPPPEKFDGADFIIHAGDVGPDYYPTRPKKEVLRWYGREFLRWALDINKPIYMTWGNHDHIGERIPQAIKEELQEASNVHILVDKQIEIEGKKVWFSPWSNLFGDWAWMLDEQGLDQKYREILDDTQIIVSHGPPHKYGDKIYNYDGDNEWVGSKSLRRRCEELPNLKLVVCGHIHEGRGLYIPDENPSWRVRNVSLVDEQYRPIHDPMIIEWN